MNPALWAAKTGLDAQQTRMAVTSNNLANVSTTGFKKGRAVFEDLLYQNVRQVGAASSQDTQLPVGPVARHRCARGRHREDLHAGQPEPDRQFAGPRDQRPRLLPGAAARRHLRLYARRQLPGELPGRARDLRAVTRAAGITIPAARRRCPSAPMASSACSSPGRPRRRRSARCSSSTSSIPPACSRAARTCWSRPRPAVRPRRHAGPQRARHRAAGRARKLERQRGRRAGEHDRDAARLRNEHQGDLDHRPDAAIPEQQL
jgi:hypothetical protein